jgi:hypothetical protein
MTRIVGVCLFRNEEIYLERAIMNVANFCDEIILLDNESEDFSIQVAQDLVQRLPHVSLASVPSPHRTQSFLNPFANTETWVLGIDGDEIYDPAGLEKLRPKILDGEFDDYFQLRGHSLHCTGLDPTSFHIAKGYITPAARPVTKLYNFNAIYGWPSRAQRLHGWDIFFKGSFTYYSAKHLSRDYGWEDCPLRCLHACFLPRTRLELRDPIAARRLNPSESKRNLDYKRLTYAVGDMAEVDLAPFFPPVRGLGLSVLQSDTSRYPVRRPLPSLKDEENAELAISIKEAFDASGRDCKIVIDLLPEIARHQTTRVKITDQPVLSVEITPCKKDLSVMQSGFEALFVEVALFDQDPSKEPAEPLSVRAYQIPRARFPAKQGTRFTLAFTAEALDGRAGYATVDLVVPGLLRFVKDVRKRPVIAISGFQEPKTVKLPSWENPKA